MWFSYIEKDTKYRYKLDEINELSKVFGTGNRQIEMFEITKRALLLCKMLFDCFDDLVDSS